MTTLQRVSWIDSTGFINHQWFPTIGTANDRVNELHTLGAESIDIEDVVVPLDLVGDLVNFLNTTHHNWPPSARAHGAKQVSALDGQVGGDHYKKHATYQPWLVLREWLTPDEFRGFMKGQAIVYLARERDKGGDGDVAKAEHYLRGMLELQQQKEV